MSYSLLNLSSSPNGAPIQITATGACTLTGAVPPLVTGQILHSGINSTIQFDEVFLYATNRHGTGVPLVLQWGTAASFGYTIQSTIAPNDGFTLVSPGLIINSGSIVYAYSNNANGPISVMGYVQRGP